jgi:hypothetical protein
MGSGLSWVVYSCSCIAVYIDVFLQYVFHSKAVFFFFFSCLIASHTSGFYTSMGFWAERSTKLGIMPL